MPVKLRQPGFRIAEGWRKGKGVAVKWGLKEAQRKAMGRCTKTG
jgi:hypothetical protein